MKHADSHSTLIRKQTLVTRITHWTWAVSMFFLLTTGLQIFNAHPILYIGDQSGFEFNNAVLSIGSDEERGISTIFDVSFDTTGLFGFSEGEARAFPTWATIPSYTDLATGRVIHFFFAWIFVITITLWAISGLVTGHLRRNLLPTKEDLKSFGADLRDHLRFKFHHTKTYGPLQKFTYALVLFGLFPLIIATGFAMSPGLNAAFPWLAEILGGRQTARTLHFVAASLLVLFFLVHILMVVLAGPINEMRSIITGWYRIDEGETDVR